MSSSGKTSAFGVDIPQVRILPSQKQDISYTYNFWDYSVVENTSAQKTQVQFLVIPLPTIRTE